MESIEKMNKVLKQEPVIDYPFVPSIYEHGARIIDESPHKVSCSARLMADAALKAYSLYQHDLVTVGIDIYNIEAEAFGCQISDGSNNSIPGIISHPWNILLP